MMAEPIESLLAEIERLKSELETTLDSKVHFFCEWSDVCDENQGLLNQLAASQAREKVFREAIYSFAYDEDGFCLNPDAAEALEQPTDDTALKAAIQQGIADFLGRTGQYVTNDVSRKAALADERERCVKIIDAQMIGFAEQDELLIDMVKAISALGDE